MTASEIQRKEWNPACVNDPYVEQVGVIIDTPDMRVRPVQVQMPRDSPRIAFPPKRILKSNNATIVFWRDGTKTIVKRAPDEAESDYAAFTAALGIKKCYGSNSALKRIVARTEEQKTKKK